MCNTSKITKSSFQYGLTGYQQRKCVSASNSETIFTEEMIKQIMLTDFPRSHIEYYSSRKPRVLHQSSYLNYKIILLNCSRYN